MNIKIVFNMFYRPFIWLTVRIFLSVPFIGPYIIVVFINKDFALDLFNSILWKNEQISIWFFWDHLIDINLWIQERYYCNWLKFSFRPNFGDFCDMFTPLFAIFCIKEMQIVAMVTPKRDYISPLWPLEIKSMEDSLSISIYMHNTHIKPSLLDRRGKRVFKNYECQF